MSSVLAIERHPAQGPCPVSRPGCDSLLAAVYVLATCLAQGVHRHGADHADRIEVGCDDARAGLAGHSAPDEGRPHHDCPACQLRAQAAVSEDSATIALDLRFDPGPLASVEFAPSP